jgi:hypothetical protein
LGEPLNRGYSCVTPISGKKRAGVVKRILNRNMKLTTEIFIKVKDEPRRIALHKNGSLGGWRRKKEHYNQDYTLISTRILTKKIIYP